MRIAEEFVSILSLAVPSTNSRGANEAEAGQGGDEWLRRTGDDRGMVKRASMSRRSGGKHSLTLGNSAGREASRNPYLSLGEIPKCKPSCHVCFVAMRSCTNRSLLATRLATAYD